MPDQDETTCMDAHTHTHTVLVFPQNVGRASTTHFTPAGENNTVHSALKCFKGLDMLTEIMPSVWTDNGSHTWLVWM